MSAPEFSRAVDIRNASGPPIRLVADEGERAALAKRFGLVAVDRLEAMLELSPDGEAIDARGRLSAAIVQSCAVSGEDLPVTIDQPLTLRFVPETPIEDEELELAGDELDEIPFAGTAFDLGEAVAQSLALAIDPFATGPAADAARREHGLIEEGTAGPLAEALRALKKD